MTTDTRDANNRLIAEWLGWVMVEKCPSGITEGPCWLYTSPDKKHHEHVGQPPDFYRSEEASALLLEKLVEIFPYFSICHDRDGFDWEIEASGLGVERNFNITRLPDRKTAIAEAALALIRQKNHKP